MKIVNLRDEPGMVETAAQWFSQKWNIPKAAYEESMSACVRQGAAVPQWYVVLRPDGTIVAGAGVIANDFHPEKALSPNVCALFVEEAFRLQGVAAGLLDWLGQDCAKLGLARLYLLTAHTSFYESCGWRYLKTILDDEGEEARVYTRSLSP